MVGITPYLNPPLCHIRTEEAVSREIELVQNEAETFQVGFGSQIWQMAMQLRSAIMEKQSEMEKGEKRREAEETNRNDGEESKSTGKQPEIIPLSKTTAPQKIGPARRRKHGNKF